jgi:hypothetical protein
VTQPETPPPRERRTLPPDPAAYDHPRAELARAKGLDAAYIPGGTDPEIEQSRREERRLLRLLLAMVIAVVLAGFVLGALALITARPA